MSTSSVNLSTGHDSATVSGEYKYRAVIRQSGLIWWSGEYEHDTQFHAEEEAEERLRVFLDDLRNGTGEVES
jgi:hypothetical protein